MSHAADLGWIGAAAVGAYEVMVIYEVMLWLKPEDKSDLQRLEKPISNYCPN